MTAYSSAINLFDVTGIVAVVTGGGSGLGLFMTRALATNGAKKVYILGRRKHVLEQAVAEIGQDNVVPLQCDVTNQEALKSAVAFIEEDIGYINLLIANSGIAGPSGSVPPGSSITHVQEALFEISMQDFTNTFHVNCTAVFYTTIAFLGLLDKGNNNQSYRNGRSQVIATSSIGSFNRRITAGFAYGASKAATTMLLKVLATYLVPYRIRANILCPGLFPTDLTTDLIHGKDPTEEGAFPLDQIPAERAGTPEDIMGPLLYLASRAGAYCNGNCVLTDGGRLSVTPATY
ncbi:3-oxoacyl-reductase [Penicillium cataractarum]|uniref:3-oxoacyl-reductase n=1 Tax=Penicillium cataractarum TaxID=2100454 RepID=A0A9W9RX37_9EURO|nr:3-oxoacyl-reductase [Penicillium cataractarum]KAJ5367892.1 3-oxoacyl-reductase [Penicillium cataractarum]